MVVPGMVDRVMTGVVVSPPGEVIGGPIVVVTTIPGEVVITPLGVVLISINLVVVETTGGAEI